MLKGAIVGFGNIAALGHWPTYASSTDVEMVAIVEPSVERQTAAQKLKPSLHCYSSLDELSANELLDFVDICTPPSSHVKLAHQAVQKGWHVLCEKPLSIHVTDYELLARALARTDRTVFTVHNWKYAPIYQTALGIVRAGTLGDIWHAEIFTLRNSHCKGAKGSAASSKDWRTDRGAAGGGILVDHGWHSFYLILNLIGKDPERLLAKMQSGPGVNALEEASQLLVQFKEADAYIHLTWRAPHRQNSAVVQGRKGTLLVADDRLLLTTTDGQREEMVFDAALSAGSHHADWFGAMFADFLTEVRDSAKRGQNFREAGWCTALTAASYDSNRRGFQEVDVKFPGVSR